MNEKELIKDAGWTAFRAAISAIPIVGGPITEFAIDARGRIKQERINKFATEFYEYMTQFQQVELNIDQIEKPEFGDFFEELIIKISKNHSKAKKEAFKKLLSNQLLNPKEIDQAELLCDIIGSLHEKQILILDSLANVGSAYIDLQKDILEKRNYKQLLKKQLDDALYGITEAEDAAIDPDVNRIKDKIEIVDKQIQKVSESVKKYSAPYKPETYNISYPQFYYLIQDLCNKGLLTDVGTQSGADAFTLYEINQLGFDLIDSIK